MHLFVDDIRACPGEWILARTVPEAQELLATGDVDMCSLDHDMGDPVLDGTYLVRWMVETGHWPKRKPFVHSDNRHGRERMESLIDKYFQMPPLGPMFY